MHGVPEIYVFKECHSELDDKIFYGHVKHIHNTQYAGKLNHLHLVIQVHVLSTSKIRAVLLLYKLNNLVRKGRMDLFVHWMLLVNSGNEFQRCAIRKE